MQIALFLRREKVQEDLASTRQYVRDSVASVHELVRDVREQCAAAARAQVEPLEARLARTEAELAEGTVLHRLGYTSATVAKL